MRVRLALVACAALLALPAASNAEDPVPTVDPSPPADPNLGEDLILLDDGGIKVGIVKLSIPSGCRRAPFRASVTGSGITRVDFRVDRRLVRSVSTADSAGRFAVRVDPRRMRRGTHKLRAAVFFGRATDTPDKQVKGTFRSCSRR